MYTRTIGPFDLLNDDFFKFYTTTFNDHPQAEDFNVELPFAGLTKDNLLVERDDNRIQVKTVDVPKDGYVSKFKNFTYTYYLTSKHDLDNISVVMKDGLLKINVPIFETQKAKKYGIKIL